MRRMISGVFLSLLLLIPYGLCLAQMPEWILKRPISPDYYIGIGMAEKGENYDYVTQARNAALSDLSSEITVNISSELVDIAVEQSGLSEAQIRQEIRITTQSELEGYELVDSWEDQHEYWVYYRLSKSLYAARKQEKLDNALSLARDLYINGEQAHRAGEYTNALQYYFQAYQPIQPYFAEPLQTNINGESIYLKNTLYTAIQSTLSQMELIPDANKIEAKTGRALEKPLGVKAVFHHQNDEQSPVANMPVTFQFIRGEGTLLENTTTDKDGQATCQISAVTAPDNIQIVRTSVDMDRLVNPDSASTMIQGIIEGLTTPETRFILTVTGLTVFVEGSEQNFGTDMEVAYVEPALKNALSEKGFAFTDDMAEADFIIEYQAQSRKGSVMYGQHVAFVDMNISVIDMQSGEEIYKQRFQNVRGIHLDFDRAGLKAYENVGEEITRDFIPAFLAKLEG
ncbi:MAG TPA: LPP20 family lipoprotein [bacterium]|nr:LPP20 family lipoprotein [bacterium]